MKKKNTADQPARKNRQGEKMRPICINKDCKIRRAGCEGSQECPGYKGK
ncbi:MAG: hypothetical protein Q7U10_10595 [Thermodesulfovibrionia bacterium]|nr:hypothetical protein [Thermodesulfovibrionia bacterium]